MTNNYSLKVKYVKMLKNEYNNSLICYVSESYLDTEEHNKMFSHLKTLINKEKIPVNQDKKNDDRIFIYFKLYKNDEKLLEEVPQESIINVSFSIEKKNDYVNFNVNNIELIEKGNKIVNLSLFDL